jgi:protein O-GlcNAc transferase
MAKAGLPSSAQVHTTLGRGLGCAIVVGLLAGLGALAAREAVAAERSTAGTAAAREQARLCERLNREEGAAACRAALALGIGPDRRGALRQALAKHLVALEKWDDLAELLREGVRLDPTSAAAWQRLGLTLLFALDERAEATGALEEAVRLAPRDAPVRVGLALALQAAGRAKEAAAAFEEALRIDPVVLDGRPAARAAMEAAGRGEPWP